MPLSFAVDGGSNRSLTDDGPALLPREPPAAPGTLVPNARYRALYCVAVHLSGGVTLPEALTTEDLDRLAKLAGLTVPSADKPVVTAGLQAQIALVSALIDPALDRDAAAPACDPRRYVES